jgi:oligopeptide transport system substrate-binding protein
VRLQTVRFFAIEELSTEEAAFRSGQLHVTSSVSPESLVAYRRNGSPLLRLAPFSAVYYYNFNTLVPPFNDVRVRRALAMALDREILVKDVTKGLETPAYTFTRDGMGGFVCSTRIPYDVAEARRLLAEAGYPGGKGFPVVNLLYNTSENHRAIAEAAQQIWRKTLNIDVELYNQEWKVYLDNMHLKNYQMCRAGLIIDPYDPAIYLRVFRTGFGYNDTGWSNPEYDRLLQEADASVDNARRFELFQRAEAILLREMPILPVYFYTRHYLMVPEVRDWPDNLIDRLPLGQAFLQD